MKTLKDRLEYSASGKNGFMACETCAEALDAITRLQGEARVMLDLLSEALGIIDTIEPESATESEYMDAIKTEIKAVLVAKAGRPL